MDYSLPHHAIMHDVVDFNTGPVKGTPDFYWHGTHVDNLDSILKNGLKVMPKQNTPYVCLATKAHIAHFFGLINALMSEDTPNTVLIRIPKLLIQTSLLRIEPGAIEISPYGEDINNRNYELKSRDWSDPTNWKEFQDITDTVGYDGTIPVSEDMIDYRTSHIDNSKIELSKAIDEYRTGNPALTYDLPEMDFKIAA